MAVDHTRPLPVAPERLAWIAHQIYPGILMPNMTPEQRATVYQIALQGEQIEYLNNVAFFLQEAYDIYNARFR